LPGLFQNLVDFVGRYDDNAAVVGDHEIARKDKDAAAGDRLAQNTPLLLARAAHGERPAEDREASSTQGLYVANGAVDDKSRDAAGHGGGHQDVAPNPIAGVVALHDQDLAGARLGEGGVQHQIITRRTG